MDRSAAGVPPSCSPLRFLSCRWDSERGTQSLQWLHTSPLTETPLSTHRPWTRAVTSHNRDTGTSGPYTAVFWACRAFGVSAMCVGCSPASLPAHSWCSTGDCKEAWLAQDPPHGSPGLPPPVA